MQKLLISFLTVGLIFIFNISLHSQLRLDNWKAHTSLVNTRSVDIDNSGRIWVASTGGLYTIDTDANNFKVFRNIDEMLDINISVVKIHPHSGNVYAGSENGYLDIYDENIGWTHITDIFSQRFSNPGINDIAFHGNKAYIAGGFGLAVFNIDRMVFEETIRRFSNFNTNNPVNRILIDNGNIWIATTNGIASANLNSQLANPANWNGYRSNPGLFETSIIDIAIYDGITYAMSEKFITRLVNDTLREYRSTQDRYTSIYSDESGFAYSTIFGMLDFEDRLIEIPNPESFVNGFLPYNKAGKSGYIVIYNNNGIGIFLNGNFIHYLPDSPLLNVSTDLEVDKNGNLWIATDIDPNGRGFAKFDGKTWENFTVNKYPEIKGNNYHKITAAPDGRIIVSNYGTGLLVLEPQGNEYNFRTFDTSNSKLYGLANAAGYLVCGKARVDNSGNIWVPILGNQSQGPAIVAFDKEYNSYGYTNPRNSNQRFFSSLAIDFFGTKWVGGSRIEGVGMMYVNENGSLSNPANQQHRGFLTQNDYPNIPDNTHSHIETDKAGFVWIGTPRGLAVISNPSTVVSSQVNINVRNLNRLIGEQNINYIMVDAQNNKWLATNNGVWVINADGSDTLGNINRSNSPLPTDEILSIGYNEITGQVYLGSKSGIYEAQSLFLQPATSFDIKCYPQPFNLSSDNEMVIDGLEEFSDIRIVTPAGALVKKFLVNSRKTIWDGRDENGNRVPNGVYLVLATSSSTKHSAVQKIAVVSSD
ncbi:MAG: hypothetical protein KIT33_03330 [Candidatus Kapabacteria bacterium]|nr:hypothetical protein [Ignavibacteriota bacterium]MCW5883983.1 hypothetical protein [Candidatus Kapabacteria bacterium]